MRSTAVALVLGGVAGACTAEPRVATGTSSGMDTAVALASDALPSADTGADVTPAGAVDVSTLVDTAPNDGGDAQADASVDAGDEASVAGEGTAPDAKATDTAPAAADAPPAYSDGAAAIADVPVATASDAAATSDAADTSAAAGPDVAVDTGGCTPKPEVCNAIDDDCDGATDEGVLCDDGDACTHGEACVGGACKVGVDQCQCAQDAECTPKGWNPCLGKWACQKGPGWSACAQVEGTAVVCPVGQQFCASQVCVASTGQCQAVPAHVGEPCDDGSACTVGDTCAAGSCQPKTALVCDDGNVCTADSCAAATGCNHPAVAGPCNDGNACTTDQCSNGSCLGTPIDCSDTDPCTLDSCSAGACQHIAVPGCVPRAEVLWGSAFDDRLWAVRAAGDGGAWAAGESQGWGVGSGDALIARSNPCGSATWLRTYGGAGKDVFYDVQSVADGALAAGVSHSGDPAGDAWVVRVSSDGAPLWHWAGGGQAYDFAKAVTATDDGGAVLAGKTYSFGPNTPELHNGLVARLDAKGQLSWSRVFGAPVGGGSMDAAGIGAVHDTQGQADGFLVVGGSEGYGAGKDDVWLLRLEADGSTRWSVAYGAAGDDDAQTGFVQLPDGGFMVGLWTDSPAYAAQNSDFALLRTDANGKLLWLRRFGGPGKDEPYGIALDGSRVVLAGFSNSWSSAQVDGLWVRVGLDGVFESARTVGTAKDDVVQGIARTSQGGFVVAGRTSGAGAGGFDAWLVRMDHNGGTPCAAPAVLPSASNDLVKWTKATWFSPPTLIAGKTAGMALKSTPLAIGGSQATPCPCQAGP